MLQYSVSDILDLFMLVYFLTERYVHPEAYGRVNSLHRCAV